MSRPNPPGVIDTTFYEDEPLTDVEIENLRALYGRKRDQFNPLARRLIVTIVTLREQVKRMVLR